MVFFQTQLEPAEKLMEYVIALGSSRMSASLLVRHILSEIGALADQLWQAFQVNARCLPHTCSSTSSPVSLFLAQ